MGGRVHDAAERQASGSAERVAAGSPVGLRRAAARTPASPFGSVLPGPLRRTMESSLGADLATVRIRDDGVAAEATRRAGAHAVTVGEDIAFAPGRYRPDSSAGRVLIAHEVTHVVQQRTDGVRPQYQDAGPTMAADEPVWVSASLHGLTLTSPGRLMPAGQPSQRAYLLVVLRRLAPTATAVQLDAVLDAIAAAPSLRPSGTLVGGRVVPEGERFASVTIRPAPFVTIAGFLEQRGLTIDLTADQRRVLRLGVAADVWAADAVAALQKHFPWYTAALWHAQLDMHTQLLADAVAAEEEAAPTDTRPANGRDALIARFRRPLEVLEATRMDTTLSRAPSGRESKATRDAEKSAGMVRLLWGGGERDSSSMEEMRKRAIQFYWTAPLRYDSATIDRSARSDFLCRLANWFGRASSTLAEAHDYTQALVRDPGRFTDPPFPAHLEAVPAPAGDLRVVPAHAEHRYRFSVDFHDVFDAFGSYAYRWDVLGWRPEGGKTAQAITDIDAGHTNAGTRTSGRRSTHHSDVLAARLGRDLAHARADVGRLADALGPAALTMAPAALGLFELRALSTAMRTLVDVVTLERGAGVRERMIQVPGPGLWVIRAAAVPIFEAQDEVHRAPSIAYIPVYAVPQAELADQALADAITAADAAERAREQLRAALSDLAGPDADAALQAMVARLLDEPRLGTDRWATRASVQRDLKTSLADIEASLAADGTPALTRSQVTLLRAQRGTLRRQIAQNTKLLDTHHGRVAAHPALAGAQPLMSSFVSDEGQTLPLAIEWAEQTREQTSTAVTLAAPEDSKFVVVADHTSPRGGMEEASGATLDIAMRNAVTTLLESRTGYGRGLVAVRLPSGTSVTFRIEASLGQLFNEALDSATTLITVAALAAAPFTAGASLTILVPVGLVAGLRAAERMYARYDASTLRWDLETLQDLVDMASAVVGVGSAFRGARAGMQISKIGRITAISFDVAENTTGFIILGVGLQEQLRAIDETPGLSVGERRAQRVIAVGGALTAAGIQGATLLIQHRYAPHRADGEPHGEPGDGVSPSDPAARTADVPTADVPQAPGADSTLPAPKPDEPTPVPKPDEPTPVPRPDVQAPMPSDEGASRMPALADVSDTTTPRSAPEAAATKAIEDLLTPGGHFRKEHGDLHEGWLKYAKSRRDSGRDPLAPHEWARRQTRGPHSERLSALLPRGWRHGSRLAPKTIKDLLTPGGRFRKEYRDVHEGWLKYAKSRRDGGRDPLAPREWARRQTHGPHSERLSALLPHGWRRGSRFEYPGASRDAVALKVPAPEPGTPVGNDTSVSWKRRVVRAEEVQPLMDITGEIYLSYPDLKPGEVLVLPNGSRIWIDPYSSAIVDSNPVGPSISAQRGMTRGEEIMHAARDRSPAHVEAGTHRLHGATSPGLGGDAPYSIAGGPPRLNLVIENAGIEKWVRGLRTNAPEGVNYVYTTRTQVSPHRDLLARSYSVGALEDGQYTPIAEFEVSMRDGGITDADVEVPGWQVYEEGMERYGAPRLINQPLSRPPGGDVSVAIPSALSRAVGGGTAADPKVVSSVTAPLEAAQRARAALGTLAERVLSTAAEPGDLGNLLFELDEALAGAQTRIAHRTIVDPESMAGLNAVVARINKITRVRTRFERIKPAELNALVELLNVLAID